jgi:hypothetical protein
VIRVGGDDGAARVDEEPELSPSKEFLERAVRGVDAAVDEAYKRLETAGRETFKQTLKQDIEFWANCARRWGQARGYRHAISAMTDQRFENNYEEAHRLVIGLITNEWGKSSPDSKEC